MKLRWLNGRGWEVLAPVAFEQGAVPVGFESDGITLPRPVLWAFIDRQGPGLRAAIIHDYLYKHAIGSKAEADRIFYRQLLADGVPEWKARVMHKAVGLFGKGSY